MAGWGDLEEREAGIISVDRIRQSGVLVPSTYIVNCWVSLWHPFFLEGKKMAVFCFCFDLINVKKVIGLLNTQ